jgi:hypothetical protein
VQEKTLAGRKTEGTSKNKQKTLKRLLSEESPHNEQANMIVPITRETESLQKMLDKIDEDPFLSPKEVQNSVKVEEVKQQVEEKKTKKKKNKKKSKSKDKMFIAANAWEQNIKMNQKS